MVYQNFAGALARPFLCCKSVLRKPWIWDNPWIVLRKAWIGRYPQFAQDNPWIAPRRAVKRKPHLREVRPGAAEILSRLCLFVNSENSQLAKWCGLYSLSLSPYRLWRSADRRLATNEGCFSDLNWKTSYCSELSDWPFELSRVLTITVEWVA